jgi:hypothetical protein
MPTRELETRGLQNYYTFYLWYTDVFQGFCAGTIPGSVDKNRFEAALAAEKE